jgi:hypothetical protein
MGQGYAKTDFEVVDYQMYYLDPDVVDRVIGKSLMLRGPQPQNLVLHQSGMFCSFFLIF